MKTIADKQVLVAADESGVPLKDAVVEHLQEKGWEVTDIGAKAGDAEPEMFHRLGLEAGSMISEGEFERALVFCGTGMGIHIAASKCPHVYSAVVESPQAAQRCVTGNNCNVMAMGASYVAPETGKVMADAFLEHKLGDGYEDDTGRYKTGAGPYKSWVDFHQLAYDELEQFDYEKYKANDFQI